MTNPSTDRESMPTFIMPNEPSVLVSGAMKNAPKKATANIQNDITSPNCCGSKRSVCVRTKGIAVECIEAQTPPMTLTARSGQMFGRRRIRPEWRVSSRKVLVFFKEDSLESLEADASSGKKSSDKTADTRDPATASFAPT
mmetsp:Transcript_18272/g.37433  ORF Transcript_18272/g.37433 Transcript_18272/m.37433 type:complete len:141 (+) Transcript_18272:455-877(+)